MPSGQFNTVVISVSNILPLDKGHYISGGRLFSTYFMSVRETVSHPLIRGQTYRLKDRIKTGIPSVPPAQIPADG